MTKQQDKAYLHLGGYAPHSICHRLVLVVVLSAVINLTMPTSSARSIRLFDTTGETSAENAYITKPRWSHSGKYLLFHSPGIHVWDDTLGHIVWFRDSLTNGSWVGPHDQLAAVTRHPQELDTAEQSEDTNSPGWWLLFLDVRGHTLARISVNSPVVSIGDPTSQRVFFRDIVDASLVSEGFTFTIQPDGRYVTDTEEYYVWHVGRAPVAIPDTGEVGIGELGLFADFQSRPDMSHVIWTDPRASMWILHGDKAPYVTALRRTAGQLAAAGIGWDMMSADVRVLYLSETDTNEAEERAYVAVRSISATDGSVQPLLDAPLSLSGWPLRAAWCPTSPVLALTMLNSDPPGQARNLVSVQEGIDAAANHLPRSMSIVELTTGTEHHIALDAVAPEYKITSLAWHPDGRKLALTTRSSLMLLTFNADDWSAPPHIKVLYSRDEPTSLK